MSATTFLRHSTLKPVVLGALLLVSQGLAQAAAPKNLVINGSFEKDPVTLVRYFTGQDLTGWQVDGTVKVREESAGLSANGKLYTELDAYRNGGVRQVLTTEAGRRYALSFRYANRSGTPVESNGLRVTVGEHRFDAPVLAPNHSGGNVWAVRTLSFTAAGPATVLAFEATGISDAVGSSLDDVVVLADENSPVTQAGAWAGGLGLVVAAASAAWARLRRQQRAVVANQQRRRGPVAGQGPKAAHGVPLGPRG